MSLDKAQAEALAAKREAHKSKHMHLKSWQAIEQDDGSYAVKLLDNAAGKHQAVMVQRAQDEELVRTAFAAAMLTGDRDLMAQVAHDGLMLKVRSVLEELEAQMLPGETREQAFMRIYNEHQDTVVQERVKKHMRGAGIKK